MKRNRTLLALLVVVGLVVLALNYFQKPKGNMAARPMANFAIDDTAAVDRIFIVDTDERSVLLERDPQSKYWTLNDTLKARYDAVELILKTIKRIKVKAPVPAAARDNVIRLLAAGGKKVEIYQGGDQPAKTLIVGNATQDHTGTYMLLETPDKGRSSEPFIVHMEGFTGFLSSRFFTDIGEWRYTGVFDYPTLNFDRVEAVHHMMPFNSFSVNYSGGNAIELEDYRGQRIEDFDTLAVKDFLLLFKKAHVETFQSHLTASQEDSLKATSPAYSFRVHEKNGAVNEFQLFNKKKVIDIPDENNNIEPWDLARMYFVYRGEVGLAQLYVFDPMVKTRFGDLTKPSPRSASR